jgi:hypothetical protein
MGAAAVPRPARYNRNRYVPGATTTSSPARAPSIRATFVMALSVGTMLITVARAAPACVATASHAAHVAAAAAEVFALRASLTATSEE